MADTEHGKKAEEKIKLWLNKPELGYSFDRIPDQMTGYYITSRNICDFICYKFPYMYYLESKCTVHDRFNFSELTTTQRDGLLLKSQITGCYGLIVVLFAEYQRAFIFNITDIAEFLYPDLPIDELAARFKSGETLSQIKTKSVNIKKISKWTIPYWEIQTVPSRKQFLDYTGNLPNFSQISDDGNL